MNAGGETADQMVRMTLQGIEIAANVTLKAGGSTAKTLAATLYAILTDNKKIKGKTRLNALLKSGKELKVFAIHHDDLKKFCEEAKRYGVLYSVLKEKGNTDGICDIMVRAEDAAKISRIVDKFELATIDTKAIRQQILAQREGKENPIKDVPIMSDKEHDDLVKSLMDDKSVPNKTRKERRKSPSEYSSKTTQAKVTERKSVRQELKKFKDSQNKNPNKQKTKGKKKTKGKSKNR